MHDRDTPGAGYFVKLSPAKSGVRPAILRFFEPIIAALGCKHHHIFSKVSLLNSLRCDAKKSLRARPLTRAFAGVSMRGPWPGKLALKSKAVCDM